MIGIYNVKYNLKQLYRRRIRDRTCYACCSNKTNFRKAGNYAIWHLNHDIDNNVLCDTCYRHYINNPVRDRMQIKYRNRVIRLTYNPKRYQCFICGKNDIQTVMHHTSYHDDEPLKDTIEVCLSCHKHVHPTPHDPITRRFGHVVR